MLDAALANLALLRLADERGFLKPVLTRVVNSYSLAQDFLAKRKRHKSFRR
jgi:hypothetical protein